MIKDFDPILQELLPLVEEWEPKLTNVLLKAMIKDYLRHFKLHPSEIDELINNN